MSRGASTETWAVEISNHDRYHAADFQRLRHRRRLTSPAVFLGNRGDAWSLLNEANRTSFDSCVSCHQRDGSASTRPCSKHSHPKTQQDHDTTSAFASADLAPRTSQLEICVIEDEEDIAQSFVEANRISPDAQSQAQVPSGRSRHHPLANQTICECCNQGFKNTLDSSRLGRRSRSFVLPRSSSLELFAGGKDAPQEAESAARPESINRGGESPIERLPSEILDEIVANLAIDLPPSGYAPRNVDLISCLLTSRTLHVATINTLYRNVTVPHSHIFSKFLNHVSEYPGFGSLVRRLDLSHFTSVGLGRSRQSNAEIQNLTADTLVRCLDLVPNVTEILLQENVDDDLDERVLAKIFVGLTSLRALDLCACSSPSFVNAFLSVINMLDKQTTTIQRLSLHECFTLPRTAFENLLPHLTHLSHLDVSHTRITDAALFSLPSSNRISHLNVGRCTQITGAGMVHLLTCHPSCRDLVYLNLACDITRYRLLKETDVDTLLPRLPLTLRSLNLNGASIQPRHVPHLARLACCLEELGLASTNLSLLHINKVIQGASLISDPSNLEADEICQVERSPFPFASSAGPARKGSNLHYIDISSISSITQSSLFNTPAPRNILLTTESCPLEVIEFGEKVIASLRGCAKTNERLGWCVKEIGRRGWYVREPRDGRGDQLGGRRFWKMGARWWGMRKVPVAWSEVGGLYGHYMFKR